MRPQNKVVIKPILKPFSPDSQPSMLGIHLAGSQGSCRSATAPWSELIYAQF